MKELQGQGRWQIGGYKEQRVEHKTIIEKTVGVRESGHNEYWCV